MKNKIMALIFSAVAVFGLSACGGGGGSDAPSNLTTLFLVDEAGFSYGGIPYKCDSMFEWSVTAPNGEFSFLPPDHCEFDFIGLEGDYNVNPAVDDIVRITDDLNRGKGNIPYECTSFGASTTFGDGSFYYDIDDRCVFYL